MDKYKHRISRKEKWRGINGWPVANPKVPHWPLVEYCKSCGVTVEGPKRSKLYGLGWVVNGGMSHEGEQWWLFIEGHPTEQELLAANWEPRKKK